VILVRILVSPLHPPLSLEATEGAVLLMKPEKLRFHVTAGVTRWRYLYLSMGVYKGSAMHNNNFHLDLTHSVRKCDWKTQIHYLCVFCVYVISYINILIQQVKYSIFSNFRLILITKTRVFLFLESFNFNFEMSPSVGYQLEKIAHLLSLIGREASRYTWSQSTKLGITFIIACMV
jgi:hypothetical protein